MAAMKRKYWYHISNTLTNKRISLTPREWGDNRGFDEPEVARLCVAPSIEQCMVALPYGHGEHNYTVYRTVNRVTASKPHGVFDSSITGERWIKRKVKMVRVGTLDLFDYDLPVSTADRNCRLSTIRKCLRLWRKGRYIERYLEVDRDFGHLFKTVRED